LAQASRSAQPGLLLRRPLRASARPGSDALPAGERGRDRPLLALDVATVMGLQEAEDLLLLRARISRSGSAAAGCLARELHRRGTAPVGGLAIRSHLEPPLDGARASVTHSTVQWRRPVLVHSVRVST